MDSNLKLAIDPAAKVAISDDERGAVTSLRMPSSTIDK